MALVPPVNRTFMDTTERFSQSAIQARSAMRPIQRTPEKTVGGAISSSAGMGMAGFVIGGPTGGLIGTGLGLASYLLS